VPLLAPLANLLAAPLVTAATALAGLGVITGLGPLLIIADWLAGLVLGIARVAGEWPQLDMLGVAALAGAALLATQPRIRPVIVGVTVGAIAITMIPPGPPDQPAITFLDVGQGDAVLLRDPSGAVALVDGGAEPDILRAGLRRYGVRRIDLLIATHGDADHVGGLRRLVEVIDVAQLWVPAGQPRSELLAAIVDEQDRAGVEVEEVGMGRSAHLGEFSIEVLGPARRYAAENDGSIVLWVEAHGSAVLLPGDIGATAQRELTALRPDVLLVPHHGAATTDLEWLADSVGKIAIISVGPNDYGHPDPGVVARLQREGATVRTTQDEGDITVLLGSSVSSASAQYLVGPAGYAPFR
jgi:competence protein ComEC